MRIHKHPLVLAIGVIVVGMLGSGYLLGYQASTQPDTSLSAEKAKIKYDMHSGDRAYKDANEFSRDFQTVVYWGFDYMLVGIEFGYNHPLAGKILGAIYSFLSITFLSELILQGTRSAMKPPEPSKPKT